MGERQITDDEQVPAEDGYLGAGEAARLLKVSPKTVSRWADKGLIPCVTTLGGHRRFLRSTLVQIQQDIYGHSTPAATDEGAR